MVDQEKQESIYDQGDEAQSDDIERESNNPNGIPDNAVDESKNEGNKQITQKQFETRSTGKEGLPFGISTHGETGNNPDGDGKSKRVHDQANEKTKHQTTMPFTRRECECIVTDHRIW